MRLKAHWPSILEEARQGRLDLVREARHVDPAGPLADYFYGRALAEAGEDLIEAEHCLRRAREVEPQNLLVVHALALALARCGGPAQKAEAAAIWQKLGLPLDLELLGQVALTLEAQTRPWPAQSPARELAWPAGLERPGDETPEIGPAPQITNLAETAPEVGETPAARQPEETEEADSARAKDAAEGAPPYAGLGAADRAESALPMPKPLNYFGRRALSRAVDKMESRLLDDRPLEVIEQADALLARGMESGEVHLVAGLAAEEAGDPLRARAHLARANALDPALLLARAYLGRVYWRCGWFELALALWRSLPVEGPYDYGRHYHLALGHAALGDRSAALDAMRIALDQFYYDTRHFYIKRALTQWMQSGRRQPSEPSPPKSP